MKSFPDRRKKKTNPNEMQRSRSGNGEDKERIEIYDWSLNEMEGRSRESSFFPPPSALQNYSRCKFLFISPNKALFT